MPITNVFTVTTTRGIVVAANRADQVVQLHSASGTIYIGGSNVTTANGYRLDNGDKLQVPLSDLEDLYAVASSGTATLYVYVTLTKEKQMNAKLKAAGMSYLRTALSAILGAYIAGQTDPKLLGSLALSAIAGPLLRALNPKDAAFGRVSQ